LRKDAEGRRIHRDPRKRKDVAQREKEVERSVSVGERKANPNEDARTRTTKKKG